MSEVTDTVQPCDYWLHTNGTRPRASHYNTKTKDWRCFSCMQKENREAMARCRKFNAVYTNNYISAEEYLFHLLAK